MARVRSDGVVLDPDGIPATLSLSPQSEPAVGWDGENYLVVWRGAGAETGTRGIYAGRVTSTGELLDDAGFPISPGRYHSRPKIAWNGTNYLIIWQSGTGSSYRTYGARVTPGGQVLDPQGILISTSPEPSDSAAVTASGSDYFVVWAADWRLYGTRVAPSERSSIRVGS